MSVLLFGDERCRRLPFCKQMGKEKGCSMSLEVRQHLEKLLAEEEVQAIGKSKFRMKLAGASRDTHFADLVFGRQRAPLN